MPNYILVWASEHSPRLNDFNFFTHKIINLNRPVNCQPSYRAAALSAGPRTRYNAYIFISNTSQMQIEQISGKIMSKRPKSQYFLFFLKIMTIILNLPSALLLSKSYQNELILSGSEVHTKCQIIFQYEFLNIVRGSTILIF